VENNDIIRHDSGNLEKVNTVLTTLSKILSSNSQHLIPYRKTNKWGFCNTQKQILIECIYDSADFFINDCAIIGIGEKYGLINSAGNIILPVEYNTIINFSNGIIGVEKDGGLRYFRIHFNELLPTQYIYESEGFEIEAFSEGLKCVSSDDKFGFIGLQGIEVIQCIMIRLTDSQMDWLL
jgi:hypothetical protein